MPPRTQRAGFMRKTRTAVNQNMELYALARRLSRANIQIVVSWSEIFTAGEFLFVRAFELDSVNVPLNIKVEKHWIFH
jgi:hypothetical protein